jgi:hypothetical protein
MSKECENLFLMLRSNDKSSRDMAYHLILSSSRVVQKCIYDKLKAMSVFPFSDFKLKIFYEKICNDLGDEFELN